MEETLHIVEHVVKHSLSDVLYLIPFLFITYLVMEWLEHKTGSRTQNAIRKAGAAGPFVGALVGAVPQCGFSAVSATLYAGRVVTLGTLFAVFLSTSDEMLPIFIAEQVPLKTIVGIIGSKIAIGMVMGFLADAVVRVVRRRKGLPQQQLAIHELCERDGCACNHDCETCAAHPELVYSHYDDSLHHSECTTQTCGHTHAPHEEVAECHSYACCETGCKGHDHNHSHDHSYGLIAKSALIHTVHVALFILLFTLMLNAIIEVIGKDTLASLLAGSPVLSVFASAVVGLIPNCAASVIITQLYIEGMLGAGALMSGLLVSAGVGLLVLCRTNRGWKHNLGIIVLLYGIGVVWGLIFLGLGITL